MPTPDTSDIRKTRPLVRRHSPIPEPLRHSTKPEPSKRPRTQTNIELFSKNLSPNTKKLKYKKSNKSKSRTKVLRDASPTLVTSNDKIINNPNILKYKQESEHKFWVREIDESKISKKKLNHLELFFVRGMSMRDCLNKELCKNMGTIFFHSELCLPVYMFRSSLCRSRSFIDQVPNDTTSKHDSELLDLSFEKQSSSLKVPSRRKTISKSTDLTKTIKKIKILNLETSEDREYLDFQMLEILQLQELFGNSPQTNLKRFCVFSTCKVSKDKEARDNIEVFSDALKKPKVLRVEGIKSVEMRRKFSVIQKVMDTIIKRLLVYIIDRKALVLDRADHDKLLKYTRDITFDPLLNLFVDYSKTTLEPLSFLPSIYFALNNDLLSFLEIFFLYDIKDFLSMKKKIQFGLLRKFNVYSGTELRHLDGSTHLFLQRTLLPFTPSTHRELRLGVLSWNLAGKDMGKSPHFFRQICRRLTRANLDVISIGFQEIVEMKISWINLKNIIFKCEEISLQIKGLLDRFLGEGYICISSLNLMGILQLVYVHHRRYSDIIQNKFINWEDKYGGKAGIKMGNKGAVGSIFVLKHFGVLSFANCHLTHGFDKVKKREEKLISIIETLKSSTNFRKKGRTPNIGKA